MWGQERQSLESICPQQVMDKGPPLSCHSPSGPRPSSQEVLFSALSHAPSRDLVFSQECEETSPQALFHPQHLRKAKLLDVSRFPELGQTPNPKQLDRPLCRLCGKCWPSVSLGVSALLFLYLHLHASGPGLSGAPTHSLCLYHSDPLSCMAGVP